VLSFYFSKIQFMKKIFCFLLFVMGFLLGEAGAYQLQSSRELGKDEAKNQNVIVKCTTESGGVSTQICSLRRYAKCSGTGANKICNGWHPWKDLRNPGSEYADWKTGAAACCRAKGLR
jgi:hypothetical protein